MEQNCLPGVGLDIGTMNIVSARRSKADPSKPVVKSIRDAFLVLPLEHRSMLKLSEVSFAENEEQLIILGDAALQIANMLGKEVSRPLSGGVISSQEQDALEILALLLENVLGPPLTPGEVCYFSIPANPVDDPATTNTYHEMMFEQILENMGYTPIAGNEAMAIVFSETSQDNFSGIAVSYGAGMANIAMAFRTLPILEFSVKRGGDWIDSNAAHVTNISQSRMCSIKEKGFDLLAPMGREQEALAVFYKNLIKYTLQEILKQFARQGNSAAMDVPIPLVVGGGTSQAQSFVDMFQATFAKSKHKFPFQISEIRAAKNPLTCVAEGLLVQAIQEQDPDQDE